MEKHVPQSGKRCEKCGNPVSGLNKKENCFNCQDGIHFDSEFRDKTQVSTVNNSKNLPRAGCP